MSYNTNRGSGGSGKMDWRGCNETAPPASPGYEPNDSPDRPYAKGDDWKGMEDGTPSSKPTSPDQQ